MILIDRQLRERQAAGRPVRVGMIGAGAMARGIALQFAAQPGLSLVAVANRHPDKARDLLEWAGLPRPVAVDSQEALDEALANGAICTSENAEFLCRAEQIEVIIEVTGAVDAGARSALEAIAHGKHVILMNAELDATLGPLLKYKADKAGVIISNVDGDQPGVIMNLYRKVKGFGLEPVLCGNIKGLQDPYRTPKTQAGFARRWRQNPHMVTSFADGTKISFEQALVANACEFAVARRGMVGPEVEPGSHVNEAANWYPFDLMSIEQGLVDYVVGADPAPGVFVLARCDDERQQHYLELYKMGQGPIYSFYTPYHLCHLEVLNTVARAALFGDATIAPAGKPHVGVVATAKRNLERGTTLDCIGGFDTYGQCDNHESLIADDLLPMGLAEGCTLKRSLARDEVLRFSDVTLPNARLIDRLWAEQCALFPASTSSKPVRSESLAEALP